jgi:hypothetical protein
MTLQKNAKTMVCTAIAFAGLNARASELPVAEYGLAS